MSRSPSSAADAKPGFRSHDGGVTLGPCHAPFVAFADLGACVGSHRPERSRHRRDGSRPGPTDPRWRGWSRLRRRGASRGRLRPGRAWTCSPGSRGSCRRWRWWAGFRRRGPSRRRLRPSRARACSPCSCDARGRGFGRSGFRRRGAAGCRLRAAGPRALNSWSRKVRHAIGQRVTAVPRDHHKGLLRREIGPGLMAASAQPWTEAAFHLDRPQKLTIQSRLPRHVAQGASLQSVNSAQPQPRLLLKLVGVPKFFNMKLTSSLLGVAGIATAILLDAAPSKAVLYLDFIPLSPTKTRIKASGTINPSHLATTPAPVVGTVTTAPSGSNSSEINLGSDSLRLTYASPMGMNIPGRRFALTGPSNPFTTGGTFAWAGPPTPANVPPFHLRFASMDFWLPDSFTGGATLNNQAQAVSGFFDVNASLARLGLNGKAIAFTSGSEQVILRNYTEIPGPVPILGAAAAFGYSRKLRNRIQKSTSSRTA